MTLGVSKISKKKSKYCSTIMMITLIFLIMMTTALSTSSVGYVRSREMLRENTGNEFFDSIEDAVAAGHRDVVLAAERMT